jgi:hypothetical protein
MFVTPIPGRSSWNTKFILGKDEPFNASHLERGIGSAWKEYVPNQSAYRRRNKVAGAATTPSRARLSRQYTTAAGQSNACAVVLARPGWPIFVAIPVHVASDMTSESGGCRTKTREFHPM